MCALILGGCASSGSHKSGKSGAANLPAAGSGRGGYYQGDGPGPNPPPNLDLIPDAVFKVEPYARGANRPYSVFGQDYTPMLGDVPYSQQGVASWYGIKFHGQRTSSGELYDMYGMTAAHPTLPIPSYVRITSLESGKQVVVRVNDRGPFIANRLIDVSYTAAWKLGLLGKGSHQVQVDRILAPDVAKAAPAPRAAPVVAPATPAMPLPASTPLIAASAAPDEITTLMLEDRMAIDTAAQVSPVAPTVTVATSTPATSQPGFYLQLGAYSRATSADDARARLQAAGIDGASLEVVQAGSIYRLFRGPFTTRTDAENAQRDLPSALNLKPIVIKR